MVLMTGAGLLGKSLYTLLHVDTGMRTDHLASVDLKWPLARYASDSKKIALSRQIVEKIVEVPKRAEGGDEVAQSAGPTKCDKELSVESVSCEVGEQVLSAYEEGHRGLFFPMDTATGETLELNCGEPTPVICKAVEGPATVIFGG